MNRSITAWSARLGVCAALALLCGGARAEESTPLSEEKPFADVHVLLQVSDAEPVHYQATLDIASNLMTHYGGQDMADIEVVAFGAGVAMLFAPDNAYADRIASLIEHGVRFYVCGNTLDTIERKQGKRPELLPDIQTVQTGVAFMLDEIRRGYVPIHP